MRKRHDSSAKPPPCAGPRAHPCHPRSTGTSTASRPRRGPHSATTPSPRPSPKATPRPDKPVRAFGISERAVNRRTCITIRYVTYRDNGEGAARGRPRDAALDQRITAVVLEVLGESGYQGVSFEEVARRCQTSKASLYRRWGVQAGDGDRRGQGRARGARGR
ncbi:TetR/AcrR family transcriptional regulator [Nonomuraea ferruginea]